MLSFPDILHSLLSWSTEFQVAFLAAVVQGRLPTQLGQGGAVALALLGGVVYAALLAAGFFLIGWRIGYMAFMAAFAVVTLAACVLLLRWLKTKGCTVFANL